MAGILAPAGDLGEGAVQHRVIGGVLLRAQLRGEGLHRLLVQLQLMPSSDLSLAARATMQQVRHHGTGAFRSERAFQEPLQLHPCRMIAQRRSPFSSSKPAIADYRT